MDQYVIVPQGKQGVRPYTKLQRGVGCSTAVPYGEVRKDEGCVTLRQPLGISADYQDMEKEGTH